MADEPENWQERVEHQRLSDKVEDLQDRIRELEITLHGKRSKTGLLAEYERHDELLRRMYAVIWQDPTGKKGLLHDIDILMGRKTDKIENRKLWFALWTAILVALIGSATAILTNLDKLTHFLPKYHPSRWEKKIEQAKHPKGKKIYRIRQISSPRDEPSVLKRASQEKEPLINMKESPQKSE